MTFRADDRARISFVDAIMTFVAIVSLVGISPWVYDIVGMLRGPADPLTATLLSLLLPLTFIALLLSIGVSGQ